MSQIAGRLTYKKLVAWVNEQFDKFEIKDYEAYKAERTYFTSYQYEGGACKLRVFFRHKSLKSHPLTDPTNYFMSFYFLKEYENYLNQGYEMRLVLKGNSLLNLEIDLVKK